MCEKVTFCREDIAENVRDPVIVEVELRHLVEERLKQCGIYYRIFSRVKTAESLERKFQIKDCRHNSQKTGCSLVFNIGEHFAYYEL